MKVRCACDEEFMVHWLYHAEVRAGKPWYCPRRGGQAVRLTILEDEDKKPGKNGLGDPHAH